MRHGSSLHLLAAVVALAASLSAVAAAQPGRRLDFANRSLVTITRIKPEMLDEWRSLQKNEVVPALKKRGVAARTVYASGVFGSAFEYTIVQPLKKFADFDAPDPQADALGTVADVRLAEKLRRCTVSTSSFLSTVLPDLSNPGEGKDAPIVGFLRLRTVPGKMQEYEAVFKAEALPALKEAKSSVTVARRGLGTDGYDLTFETPMTTFADLDAPPPLVRFLGPEGAAMLVAKLNGLATVIENTVLVRQADLSF
jgi:hypothetical protein